MPLVTIIIPVYNTEKYLRKCLDVILSQTLKDIEVLCIDDGSVDNSLEILKEYARNDSRIKCISQENKGVAAVRNLGLELAQGEYIGFVDSDDLIGKDYFEKLYNTAKKYDADIAVCSIVKVKNRARKSKCLTLKEEKVYTNTEEKLFVCELPQKSYVWNKLFKNDFLKNNNLRFLPLLICEDMPFSVEAFYYSDKLVTVPNIYYSYVKNSESLVVRFSPEKEKILNQAKDWVKNFAKEKGIDLSIVIKANQKYRLCGVSLLRVETYRGYKTFYLFNCIPIWKRKAV